MYPHRYYDLFPAFPSTLEVFVAMSFDERFDHRFREVIRPGIEAVTIGAKPLIPVRVDARVISDSILTEILGGIGRSRLIFVDVTSEGSWNDRPIRNGNVMYELGIAHATRTPEEVVVFRSDDEPLLFDTANIRVNRYTPDTDPVASKKQVAKTVLSAIREIDITRNTAVAKAASSLDAISWSVLSNATRPQGIQHLPTRTMREALGNAQHNAALLRLLDVGAIEADFKVVTKDNVAEVLKQPTEELVRYRATPFGQALNAFIANRMRLTAPDVLAEISMKNAMDEQRKREVPVTPTTTPDQQ